MGKPKKLPIPTPSPTEATIKTKKDLICSIVKKKTKEPELGEEAAGVGIITKQNTTADVNKGTLRKMMKGYKLV